MASSKKEGSDPIPDQPVAAILAFPLLFDVRLQSRQIDETISLQCLELWNERYLNLVIFLWSVIVIRI
jgi:hypothetical protein